MKLGKFFVAKIEFNFPKDVLIDSLFRFFQISKFEAKVQNQKIPRRFTIHSYGFVECDFDKTIVVVVFEEYQIEKRV